MSLDQQAEDALYKAINKVRLLPWPKQRERILKEALSLIAGLLGLDIVMLEREDVDGKKST